MEVIKEDMKDVGVTGKEQEGSETGSDLLKSKNIFSFLSCLKIPIKQYFLIVFKTSFSILF